MVLAGPLAGQATYFFTITPCRVLDTRQTAQPLTAGVPRVFQIAGATCPIPLTAKAVAFNVTAVASSGLVQVRAFPGNLSPVVDTIVAAGPGQTRASLSVLRLATNGAGTLGVLADFGGGPGQVDLILDASGYFDLGDSFVGTAGFITTRPTCVPPNSNPDPLNYIQGPDPLRLSNGDVTILVNAGLCCSGHWEGIFSLNYPAAGRAATPRFSGLWATNDFDTASRGEDEAAFPSAVFFNAKWRIAYSSTFLPRSQQNRHRVGRLDLSNLMLRSATSQVTNAWVKPIDPNCRTLGTCTGKGTGPLGTFATHPNGDLYVYHPDDINSTCASKWVRHKIATDMTIPNPLGNGCLSFEGLTGAPPFISDIGRTADGRLLMLGQWTGGISHVEEWVSTGDAATIGLQWRPSGRRWKRPVHPTSGYNYYVRDAAYLKDSNRTVLEPKVVVSQISDGQTFAEMTDVTLGRFYLYYWADYAAVLPPTFGGPANACKFAGNHDAATCTEIRGWGWDPMFPNSPISVEIYDGTALLATVPANIFRQGLLDSGKGDGRHEFRWAVPASLRDGATHSIRVKYAQTDQTLANSPKTITCN